jgi:ABC-type branched-subunit amino acid transport system ATPase component
LLEAKNITKKFGEVVAIDDLSFKIPQGSIVGLIGPNGSGKTTLLNLITGFCEDYKGQFFLKGNKISGLKPHEISKLRIGRTFQETRVFRKMSILENLLVASNNGNDAQSRKKALDLLKFVGIYDIRNQYARNLSYGQQKLLEFARVLMLDPELILFDEPTAGINPILVEKMLEYFSALNQLGKTLIIVEHNTPLIFDVSQKVIVLDHGQKIAEGTPDEIQNDIDVQRAYLGGV